MVVRGDRQLFRPNSASYLHDHSFHLAKVPIAHQRDTPQEDEYCTNRHEREWNECEQEVRNRRSVVVHLSEGDRQDPEQGDEDRHEGGTRRVTVSLLGPKHLVLAKDHVLRTLDAIGVL
jgi:hypothetical protein